MSITFGQAKKIVAQWAGRGGKCSDDPEVDLFLRQVLDYMLISGQYGNLRRFTFSAVKGVFTAPYELETIIKVKIDNEVSSSWDKWFDWGQYNDLAGCIPNNAIFEEPNYSPIVYDVPAGGAHIGTLGICEEDCEAHIIVKGFDTTGRQVITQHNGESVVGEYLRIERGQIKYTNVKFGRITEIYKTKTKGYVQLLWLNPFTNERGFLADYSPFEETPKYRRYRLNTRCATYAQVSVIGRIRLKEYYAENDLIPFDNVYALSVAAQAVYANYNEDSQNAQAKDNTLLTLIQRENETKSINNGRPVEVAMVTAGGSIKGIVF